MEKDEKQDNPGKAPEKMSEGEIDSNIADTFPASDPPSWTLGTDHPAESAGKERKRKPKVA